MSKLTASAIFIFCAFLLIIGLQQGSGQSIDPNVNAKYEILEDLKIKDTHILSASIVTDDSDLPKYCRVTGYVLPAINFEIRLPLEQWNGKFYMTGCGGFCGSVNSDSKNFYLGMNYGLKRNYAISTMDAGHWGESFTDGQWAMNNRIAEIDWAYRAVHETARVSKLVIEAFYGQEPEKSYFNGCSNGGRMAVMEALRYPEDFDGIISGAPAIDLTDQAAIYYSWIVRSNIGPDGKDIVSLDDLKLITEVVYSVCDEIDGLKDGL
jgi:feruloyl esterase